MTETVGCMVIHIIMVFGIMNHNNKGSIEKKGKTNFKSNLLLDYLNSFNLNIKVRII